MSEEIIKIAEQARQASLVLQSSTTEQKNATITKIREFLEKDKEAILKANQQDLEVISLNSYFYFFLFKYISLYIYIYLDFV